jgi:hypothetical protein
MPVPKAHPVILWLCALLLLFPLGCAHVDKPAPAPDLDSVAVVCGAFTPEFQLDKPAKGWLAGAGRGFASWSGKAMAAPFQAGGGGSCSGQGCGLAYAVLLAVAVSAATVGGIAGSVVGAVKAQPAQKVEEAEAVIARAVAGLKAHETLRDHVLKKAQGQTPKRLTAVEGIGPASLDDRVAYGPLAQRGFDTVLQLSVVRLGLVGQWEVNPPLRLTMSVQAKMIRTADNRELFAETFPYLGASRPFSEWSADDARLLEEEFEACYDAVAARIVSRLFP